MTSRYWPAKVSDINRKLQMRFQLVPKSMTLADPELPTLCTVTVFQNICIIAVSSQQQSFIKFFPVQVQHQVASLNSYFLLLTSIYCLRFRFADCVCLISAYIIIFITIKNRKLKSSKLRHAIELAGKFTSSMWLRSNYSCQ